MRARDEILDRVRAALGGPSAEPAKIDRAYRTHGDHPPGHPALIELFTDRLEDYRAYVHHGTEADIPSLVASILAPIGTGPIAPRVVVPQGLAHAWLPATIEAVPDDELPVHVLETFDAVTTAATVAVAETGTIVLDAAPDQGRRIITLLPDLHICVIRTDQIVATVPEALTRLAPARPQTWISGPSATSDIELSRVEGVHGPRTLHVVIVEAGPSAD
jgi:L-lactate dehydrogenase complex protein LldG